MLIMRVSIIELQNIALQNIGVNLCEFWYSDFLDLRLKVDLINENIEKVGFGGLGL